MSEETKTDQAEQPAQPQPPQQPEPKAEQVQPPKPVNRPNAIVDELKHSVQMHMTIMNGPSQQLSAFLLKTLDFIEDADHERRDKEMAKLSFVIIESLAVFVQQSIDDRAKKAENQGVTFPPRVKQAGDNLLVVIGKTRSQDDKIAAKNTVLTAIADALRELSSFTKAKYPSITDSQRREL